MRHIPHLLASFILILILFPAAATAEEGQIRIGILGEYSNLHYGNGYGKDLYGSSFGVLLGYEKQLADDLWYAIDGKVMHGSEKTTGSEVPTRITKVRTVAKVGTVFNYGFDIKPFIGLGINYDSKDLRRGYKDLNITDYILPLGVSLEKKNDYGLIGTDIQYEYVLHRDFHFTNAGWAGRTESFDGSCNVELGVFFEPKGSSLGFRPYFRYEHANRMHTDGSVAKTRNSGGMEIYYRF